MVHHWVSNNVKQSGYDDMVLLSKISEQAIHENLKKRFNDNYIYTYIGPVLISVNPYKELPYFTDKEIEQYKGATQIENPPHIYATADFMYRNMIIDNENQCVIISGESGAGKTVCAKYIMNYISKISGGNQSAKVQHVKNIILQSNPLLEAFGNAKTLRNNNSSRFGKYVEIQFARSGEPDGGKITNFLLEKSRVVSQMKNERNFHIFYQLCANKIEDIHKTLGIIDPSRFAYLNKSGCYEVDGVNDSKEFHDVLTAMRIINISSDDQATIFKIIAGILHLGNISFVSNGNYSQPEHNSLLEYPSHLLGINKDTLKSKLTSRTIETKKGFDIERIDVSLNCEQAEYTRDALAKGIYSRLFDHLVAIINSAMEVKNENLLNISILDIYGFEIFNENGFEQFCINYVNEKLQQIFIELTLKAEQEEYKQEGIKWTDIDFFNNKIVCDLIESKTNPPGLFSQCDDVVITMHAVSQGADQQLLQKFSKTNHKHFASNATGFLIKHYAGDVDYNINGFCEKNRDVLFQDLIDLMKSSSNQFISNLFNSDSQSAGKRPTTAGTKIRNQANALVDKLKKCYPSYIRCIKPNETKQPNSLDENRVLHQIKYLGLVENIRVRRAGFAYRREFSKFIQRYCIVAKQTRRWTGPTDQAIKLIMQAVNIDQDQYQLGKTKIFIKAPESLSLLEELRDRKYNEHALVLQKAFRKHNALQYFLKLKNEAADLMYQKKERRSLSVNRKFYGDYIGLDNKPALRALINKREQIEFAQTCIKYNRQFKKQKRDFILTNKAFYIIGREEEGTSGSLFNKFNRNNNKKLIETIKRRIDYNSVEKIVLSHLQDNFLILYPQNDYANVLEVEFKTEFLTTFSKRYKEAFGKPLIIEFNDEIVYKIKKEGFMGGGERKLQFVKDQMCKEVQIKSSVKSCEIRVSPGLPNTTRPSVTYYQKYNFESESWWPKFNKLREKYNIQIVKGDKKQKSNQKNQSIKTNNNNNKSNNNQSLIKPPIKARRPVPPPIEPQLPKCKALYPYSASDSDELSFQEGEIIYIVSEDSSGWWNGKLITGKTGLFPSNYIEKI